MLDVRLAQLRHFLLVVETKSFRTAAKRAFRSQPALSQSIRQLESRLGQPLFEKGARTTLTPFGETCLPLVRELVAQVEYALSSMQQVAQLTGGRVALALSPSVATHVLPRLMPTFVKSYPGVEVEVHAEDSRKVYKLVVAGEVDFGVSSLQKPDPNISFSPLLEDRFGLLCRADHPLAKSGRPVSWDCLHDQPVLGHLAHQLLADTPVWQYVAQPRIQLSNLPTLFSLVEHALGVTPIPALACPVNLRGLAFLPLVKPIKTRTIGLLSPAGRSMLPAAQAMVDLMKAQLCDADWGAVQSMVKPAPQERRRRQASPRQPKRMHA